MKKYIIITLSVLGFHGVSQAQTGTRIDQYYLDLSVANPAAINMHENAGVSLYYNKMYSKVPGAGQNVLLNAVFPVAGKRTGFGITYAREKAGFQQLHNAYATYAYSIPFSENTKLHLGVSLGVLSQNFDASQAVYISQNDPVIKTLLVSPAVTRADLRGSAMLQAGGFFGGAAVSRMVTPRFDYSYYNYKAQYNLQTLSNLLLGYRLNINDNFSIKPSVQFLMFNTEFFRFQSNVSASYQDKVWAGVGINSQNQYALNVGFKAQDAITCGYSFSFASGAVQSMLGPTHELTARISLAGLGSGTPAEETGNKSGDEVTDEPEVKPTTGKRRYQDVNVKALSDLQSAGTGLDTAGIHLAGIPREKTDAGYYLVTGLHSSEAKADQMIKNLYMQDIIAFKFFDVINNSYYVYLKQFKTEKEANRFIQYYESNLPQAWIRQVK
ncbi:MAG: PorP/SprF family type IX secretion system membrane protein [Bacteroidetes bacterium]|nr:PorP/SprF family type IX secretion system membrane protein [Bacteroidota bacterium]